MKAIEERLKEQRQTMNTIQAPAELEERLRNALKQVPVPAKRKKIKRVKAWTASIAAAILLIVGTYQYPAIAYYGGKLLNKSELSALSFSEVAEKGYGQKVGKSETLPDGTVITINGIVADENALLMYYSIDRKNGSVFNDNGTLRYQIGDIKGFMTHSKTDGGSSDHSKDETYQEGVYRFEPVSPFSRTLTVTFSEWLDLENGKKASYPISFKYDANKAMKNILKKEDISESISVGLGTVYYDSITASPTTTIVKGHYKLNEEAQSQLFLGTKLYVNGTEVKKWRKRTYYLPELGTPTFEIEFDVLPSDKIESIELALDYFTDYQKLDQPISLASPSDQSIKIGSEKIWIRNVTKTTNGYDIVIARKQFTYLDQDSLSIHAGGKEVPVSSISSPRPWDLNNGNTLWEQTYSFNTSDKPELLYLDGFHYIKKYDKTISIPVDKK